MSIKITTLTIEDSLYRRESPGQVLSCGFTSRLGALGSDMNLVLSTCRNLQGREHLTCPGIINDQNFIIRRDLRPSDF